MNSFLKISIIIMLFALLAGIRFFESELFYDPFLSFFKGKYQQQTPPEVDFSKLLVHTSFRYFLNSVISLGILCVAFQRKAVLRFSLMFYVVAFIILLLVFSYFLLNLNSNWYQVFFYVRRFLIQPIFVLVLLPAFYYQQYIKKAES